MMNATVTRNWQQANQQYLAQALAEVRTLLQQYLARLQGNAEEDAGTRKHGDVGIQQDIGTFSASSLEFLCAAFGLTSFERHILLLCAGVELSALLAQLCGQCQGNLQFSYPTFSLALAAFPEADWSALVPVAPLRRWRLIEVAGGESLTQSRLRIDERVLHYLAGVPYLDDRLQGLIEPLPIETELPASHNLLAQQIADIWSQIRGQQIPPAIQLCGDESDSKWAIASAVSATMGIQLYFLRAADIPQAVAEREALTRLWEREAILSRSALLLEWEDLTEVEKMRSLLPFIENVQSLLLISGREPLQSCRRKIIRLDISKVSMAEQRSLWQNALGNSALELNGQLDTLVSQFSLSASTIYTVCNQVKELRTGDKSQETEDRSYSLPASPLSQLWDTCRTIARPRLETLAQRIVPKATWDDLVLPEPQRQILHEMAAQVRQRAKVYETWEFAIRGSNGLGISALFVGASGTGKTMAAEVLAHELRLDLYRIDLSQVVSKYIGETEKNLRRVFDAAEAGGAILLFDEADALFGKRSEVKDSHDRYANIEVSYLLQRMEAYRGLAILTTNMKNAIDTAFLRRIRFIVQFPFPDFAQRIEIWRRIFPPKMPTEKIDLAKLAKLNIAGGNIRNIALNAAFLAADTGESVQMKHLLRAAQSEYAKLDKQPTEAEVRGWA
ncbi:ATP-binding protein [Scytonema sp. PRP1]|uniref:ATP-binding protein n=1 Tax=Scytonema sp. PRP1 TaxID=3120513 RepID=UPI00300C9249